MKRFSKITTTQLARICGVSQGTVDRALHNRDGISPSTRDRILEIAKEYDYRPSIQGGEQANSMLLGVVLFDLNNEYFSKLAMSLIKAAKKFGYSIIFQFSEKNGKTEKQALEYFDYIGVDGIVLFSVGSDSEEYRNYLHTIKKPIVLIGNRLFDLPFIGIDDGMAMRQLTKRLAQAVACKDILYFAPALKKPLHAINAQRLRLDGFMQAMNELGRSYRVVTEIEELTDFGGIVCGNDYYAMRALKYLGYPKDVPIAGFDNISVLKDISVRVLSVEYSTDKIAEEAINFILGRPYTSKVEHELVCNTDE
ncbi:MAG: LacI family DNA-binding transcriptional regulator [Clostridia bacterium]|nr:LacI family DNA-binding transcriptional regulator [Clostridia bacterium]